MTEHEHILQKVFTAITADKARGGIQQPVKDLLPGVFVQSKDLYKALAWAKKKRPELYAEYYKASGRKMPERQGATADAESSGGGGRLGSIRRHRSRRIGNNHQRDFGTGRPGVHRPLPSNSSRLLFDRRCS